MIYEARVEVPYPIFVSSEVRAFQDPAIAAADEVWASLRLDSDGVRVTLTPRRGKPVVLIRAGDGWATE